MLWFDAYEHPRCLARVAWDGKAGDPLIAPVQTGLREAASPSLHDLCGATVATGHLAVRQEDRALYGDRLAGRTSVPAVRRLGARLPLHATDVGRDAIGTCARWGGRGTDGACGPHHTAHRCPRWNAAVGS